MDFYLQGVFKNYLLVLYYFHMVPIINIHIYDSKKLLEAPFTALLKSIDHAQKPIYLPLAIHVRK